MMRSTWKRALSTILTVCMIASLLVVPASATTSVLKIDDVSSITTGTEGTTTGIFTIYTDKAAGSSSVTFTDNGTSVSLSKYVQNNGATKGKAFNTRSIVFETAAAATVKVYWTNGESQSTKSSDVGIWKVTNVTDTAENTADYSSSTQTGGTYTPQVDTFNLTAAGTYAIGGHAGKCRIYYVEVTEAGGDDGSTSRPIFAVDEYRLPTSDATTVEFTLSSAPAAATTYKLYAAAEGGEALATSEAVTGTTVTFTYNTAGSYYVSATENGKTESATRTAVTIKPFSSVTGVKVDGDATIVKTVGDAAFTLTATTTPTADGPVTWASVPEDVAAVDANTGEVTIKAAGQAVITATSTENADAKGSVTVQVKEADGTTFEASKLGGIPKSSLTAGTELPYNNFFTIVAHGNTQTSGNSAEWNDAYTSSKVLSLGGKATLNAAAVKFTTAKASTVEIWWTASANDRLVTVLGSDGTAVATAESVTANTGAYNKFDLATASTYYVGSNNSSINIAKIVVTEKTVEEPKAAETAAKKLITDLSLPEETALTAISFEQDLTAEQDVSTMDDTARANFVKGILDTKLSNSDITVNVTKAEYVAPQQAQMLAAGDKVEAGKVPYEATLTSATDSSTANIGGTITLMAEEAAPTTYDVTIGELTYGNITAEPAKAEAGATVTLTVTPNDGYELDGNVSVAATTAGAITVSAGSEEGKYTFTMPAEAVTVSAAFKAQLKDMTVTVTAPEDLTYDGQVKTLGITVKDGETTITEGLTIQYSIDADGWVANPPQIKDAKDYTIYVKAIKEGYNAAISGACTFTIGKAAAPTLSITADHTSVKAPEANGTSTVVLTVNGTLPTTDDDGEIVLTATPALAEDKLVKASGENKWTATLADATQDYVFQGKYEGDANHTGAQTAQLTVHVTAHGEPQKSAFNFKAVDAEKTFNDAIATWEGDKPAWADLQENIAISSAGKATGTLKYVEGFTAFNLNKPNEQEGWYLPIMIAPPKDWVGAGKTAKLTVYNGESGTADKSMDVPADALDTAADGSRYIVLIQACQPGSQIKMKIDWDGDGTEWTESDDVTMDISGVTFEGKDASSEFVFATLTDAAVSTEKGVSAKKVGYQTYEVTISTGTLTAHKRTGVDPADTEDAFWVGVGIPKFDMENNSLFVSKDEGTSWTHIGANESGEHYMTYTSLTPGDDLTAGATKTLLYKITADNAGEADENGEVSANYTVTFKADELVYPTYNITSAEVTTPGCDFGVAGQAKAGDTVEITLNPAEGYEVDTVTVDGEAINPTDGKYTFTMPAKDVEVAVTFKEKTVTPGTAVKMGWHVMEKDAVTTAFTAETKIETAGVKGVEMYWGPCAWKFIADKDLGTDVIQGQSDPSGTPPTTGAYLHFKVTQPGKLVVNYAVMSAKTSHVATKLNGATEFTTTDETNTAKGLKTYTLDNAVAGDEVYIWVSGSKVAMESFTFEAELSTEDAAAVAVDLGAAKTAVAGGTYTATDVEVTDVASATAKAEALVKAALAENAKANSIWVEVSNVAETTGGYTFDAKLTSAADETGETATGLTLTVGVSTKYAITVAPAQNGAVTTDPATEAAEGQTVVVNAQPADGYELDTIAVTKTEGGDSVSDAARFTMPAFPVTVTVTFKEIVPPPAGAHTFESAKDLNEVTTKGGMTAADYKGDEYFTPVYSSNTKYDTSTAGVWTGDNAYDSIAAGVEAGRTDGKAIRFNMGGKTKNGTEGPGVKFTTANANAKVQIWWVQAGGDKTSDNTTSDLRQIAVLPVAADGSIPDTATYVSKWAQPAGSVQGDEGRITTTSPLYDEFTLVEAGTYMVGSLDGSNYIFKIVVTDAAGETPEKVTVTYELAFDEAPATVPAAPAAVELDKGGKVATLPNAPTVEGYTFAGWFVGETAFTTDTVVDADVTVTGKYTKNAVVTKPLTKIEVAATATVEAGKTAEVAVTLTPADTEDTVVVTSADDKIATGKVENGKLVITGVAKGEVKLTLSGKTATDVKAEITVTVTEPVVELKDIVFTFGNDSVVYDGTPKTIEAVVTEPTEGVTITYATSQNGTYAAEPVTITDAGEQVIWVKIEAEGYKTENASAKLTVTKVPAPELTIAVPAGKDNIHSANEADRKVTFTVTPAELDVEITCDKTVTFAEDGSVTLDDVTAEYVFTATYAGDKNHEGASAQVKVYVTKSDEVNKTALKQAIEAAAAKMEGVVPAENAADVAKGEKWATQTAIDTLTDAIEVAQAVVDNKDATADDVAAAVTTLNAATTAFEPAEGTKEADPKALADAIAAAKAKLAAAKDSEDGDDVYTNETWISAADKADLQAAIDEAKDLLEDGISTATQAQIDAAAKALNDAVKALIKNGNKSTGGGGGGYRPSTSTGTTTTTETLPDGTKRVTETKKDGTVIVTDTKPDGTKVVTTTDPDGAVTSTVTVPSNVDTTTVSVPVADANTGMVAVIVKPDGTEEIIRATSIEDGEVVFPMDESGKIKIINNAKHFVDIDGHWAEDDVNFVSARELFNGVDATHFAPDATMTRGMMATVLFRLDGEKKSEKPVDFSDVKAGDWFADAVDWASEVGVINGYTDGTFAPNKSITREELVVMVYRYAGAPKADAADMSVFTDAAEVADWAAEAMNWAVKTGIINGRGNGILDPKGNATRAEVSAVLERFVKLANQ